jgi:hypothetical protein
MTVCRTRTSEGVDWRCWLHWPVVGWRCCSHHGLCGYAGTETWQPAGPGDITVSTYERHGRRYDEAAMVLGGAGIRVRSAVQRSQGDRDDDRLQRPGTERRRVLLTARQRQPGHNRLQRRQRTAAGHALRRAAGRRRCSGASRADRRTEPDPARARHDRPDRRRAIREPRTRLVAAASLRRPKRDLLAALGVGQRGNPSGIRVAGAASRQNAARCIRSEALPSPPI